MKSLYKSLQPIGTRLLYLCLGILLVTAISSRYPDMWQPPRHDATMIGIGNDEEPMGCDTIDYIATKTDIENAGGGEAAYLVYTALLTQSGTDAPVATVLENTLGVEGVTARNGIGDYNITFTGISTTWQKVYVYIPTLELNNNFAYDSQVGTGGGNLIVGIHAYDASGMRSQDFPPIVGNLDDSMLAPDPFRIEIRVYPESE